MHDQAEKTTKPHHADNAERAARKAEAQAAKMDDLAGSDDYNAGLDIARDASREARLANRIFYYTAEYDVYSPEARRVRLAAARAAKAAKDCWGIIEANAEAIGCMVDDNEPTPATAG